MRVNIVDIEECCKIKTHVIFHRVRLRYTVKRVEIQCDKNHLHIGSYLGAPVACGSRAVQRDSAHARKTAGYTVCA